ncbi:hypothetical protein FBF24_04480 [Candidatus Saccharibacteria bacterium oral taxon 488]|nr:hypothetical protein FBF24_04480 [Candidatus Saccharibacteria bacterium oral taxon 488]
MRDSLTVEIVRVRQENPEVTTLYVARPFDFMAGQYITVFIEGSQVREGKAYSISSRPHEELMSITVKNVGGEFSSYLCSRQVGDTLQISRAYGDFNPQTERPLVGIAAGCGLSPIWSILADAQQPTFLYFSQKSPEYMVFSEELVASNITVKKFSTRQQVEERDGWHNGRFEVAKIVSEVPNDAHFLVCGSLPFVRDVWQKLTAAGVDESHISTETFFEQ